MNKYFNTIKILFFLVVLTIGAGYAFAQVDPGEDQDARPQEVSGLPGPGIAIPIHTGFNQTKAGSLSVKAFAAQDGAGFSGQPTSIFFEGMLRADNPSDPTGAGATLQKILAYLSDGGASAASTTRPFITVGGNVGGKTYATSIKTTGPVIAKEYFVASSLVAGGELCADATGTVILCNQTQTNTADICTNVEGVQTIVPRGMYVNGSGTCLFPGNVPTPDDYCHNIAGAQTTMSQYSDRGVNISDPFSYYAITSPENLKTALTDIKRELAFDAREQFETGGTGYQDALDDTNNAITLLQNAINAGGVVSSYGGPELSGKNLGQYLNDIYGSVRYMESADPNMDPSYDQLAASLYSLYKDARSLQVTQLSFDSGWNCLQVPTLVKVQATEKTIGVVRVGDIPVTLTFDRPLLADQKFEIWGYLTASGFRDAKIRQAAVVSGKEGDTTARLSSGTLYGDKYWEFLCIRPETLPGFSGIPNRGAKVGYQYQQWADVNGSYELVRSSEPFDNNYAQKNNNCQTNSYPTNFNYQ